MNQTNDKKGFLLYFDSYDNLALLSDEQRGKLLLALIRYARAVREGEDLAPMEALKNCPELDPQASMAFGFLADTIRRDTKEWLKRRDNYRRGAKERLAGREQQPSTRDGTANYVRGLGAGKEGKAQEEPDAAWNYV